uniref:WKF domain-containing protein n=1 Tax=Anopheles maculatus TaxID=74869 RepID=A0A182SXG5_9DIPT
MGKKNKIEAENVAPAEQMEHQDAPPAKKKGKKHSSAEVEPPAETNGTEMNGTKKDKKKKSKGLTASDANNHAESEIAESIGANDAEEKKSKKKKKNNLKPEKDVTEEDEQLISFKKSTKKRAAEPKNMDEEAEVPPKVSKADTNAITAGTTIDQVAGIKLKNKKGKRAKGRENQAVQVEEKRLKSKKKEREEMHKYLECWSTNRDKWKFHKQTQIHIQKHVFDAVEINDKLLPIALEYLSGSKGSCKEMLVKRAKSIIEDGDAKAAAADGDETLQASSKYERARELLQFLG